MKSLKQTKTTHFTSILSIQLLFGHFIQSLPEFGLPCLRLAKATAATRAVLHSPSHTGVQTTMFTNCKCDAFEWGIIAQINAQIQKSNQGSQ